MSVGTRSTWATACETNGTGKSGAAATNEVPSNETVAQIAQ
jgi:hypothetical protein